MPAEDGAPTLPTTRAVRRVIQNTTGQEPTVGEPRVMRADIDDELWQQAPPEASQTPGFGVPRELQFDLAKTVAQQYLVAQEEERMASQLRQPDLPQSSYVPEDPIENMYEARPRTMGGP